MSESWNDQLYLIYSIKNNHLILRYSVEIDLILLLKSNYFQRRIDLILFLFYFTSVIYIIQFGIKIQEK